MPLSRINANSIADGTVVASEIGDNAVSAAKIQSSAVTTDKIADANVTFAKLSGGGVISGNIKPTTYQDTFVSVSISSGNVDYNLENGNFFYTSLTEDIANVNFQNPPPANTAFSFVVQIVGNGSENTISWPSVVKYKDNTAPTIVTTSGNINTFAFYTTDGGSSYVGTAIVGQHS